MNPSRTPAFIQRTGVVRDLGSELLRAGLQGPVLVVAGTTAISQLAPDWAVALGSVGWKHRVRAFGGRATSREVSALAAEAVRWQARVIVAAGGGQAIDAARAAATSAGLPLVACPTSCATPSAASAVSVVSDGHRATPGQPAPCEAPMLVLVDPGIMARSPPALLAAGIAASLSMLAIQRMDVWPPALQPEAEAASQTLSQDGAEALEACRAGQVNGALERVVAAILSRPWTGADCSRFAASEFPAVLRRVSLRPAGAYGAEMAFGAVVELLAGAALAQPERREMARAEAERLSATCRSLGLPMTLAALGGEQLLNQQPATGLSPRFLQAMAAAAPPEAAAPGG